MEELNKTIERLSSTLYHNLSRRSVALMILKEKFYDLFPEVESLIEETKEKKGVEAEIPTVRIGESVEMSLSGEGEFSEGFRDQYLDEDKNEDE